MTPDLTLTRAKALRTNATPPEKMLWSKLRNQSLTGVKFRRQVPFGQYIVDFYCPQAKLVIELDGHLHGDTQTYDTHRTQYLEQQGLKVIRFTNGEVSANLTGVLETIMTHLPTHSPSPPHPKPLPQGEREPPSANAGHRARLRKRFIDNGADALADYELLELLLFGAIPQKDTKPLAKELLKKFGDLHAVLHASTADLLLHFPKQPAIVTTLRLAHALAQRSLRQTMIGRSVFNSWQSVLDYCQLTMAHLPHEEFRLLFLDAKNALIGEEVHQRGTINHTPAYPREIVKRALEKGAAALILVHNHPTGDPMPSRQDIELTKQIKKAAEVLNITIHDHLIIGREKHVSFRSEGLL